MNGAVSVIAVEDCWQLVRLENRLQCCHGRFVGGIAERVTRELLQDQTGETAKRELIIERYSILNNLAEREGFGPSPLIESMEVVDSAFR